MSNLRLVDRIYNADIPILKKVIVGSTLVVALAAIVAGSYFHGAGALACCGIGIGGTLFLLDVAYCIYLYKERSHFIQVFEDHKLRFPFERFKPHERAYDFESFVHEQRGYSVLYYKNVSAYQAYYFAENSQLIEKESELNLDDWVTSN